MRNKRSIRQRACILRYFRQAQKNSQVLGLNANKIFQPDDFYTVHMLCYSVLWRDAASHSVHAGQEPCCLSSIAACCR